MDISIIGTKLNIPNNRKDGVIRQRLINYIQTSITNGCKLVLISAPAGYGKTTLVTNWIQFSKQNLNETNKIAWYSLDSFDNNIDHFLKYFLYAFQLIHLIDEDFSKNLISKIPYLQQDALINTLINQLINNQDQIIFVLDDFHVIENFQIHTFLEYFIEHLPNNIHLIIITREDPSLPLARMRARNQMAEIRAKELRFTSSEAYDFFRLTMNLQLDQESVISLEQRTEGWAAGLQLAALAIKNNPDPKMFISSFGGSHRYVLDYLIEEVIANLPVETKNFLIKTSILDRFNAEICQSLTGRTDSQQLLDKLDQTNMFIIPLDNEREWFRYHHLFAEYLRTELNERVQADLSRMASIWFESKGFIEESVRYALASRNDDFAADIIERALQNGKTWSGGDLLTLTKWIVSLSETVFETKPFLSLQVSRLFYLSVNFDKAEKLLDQTEHFLNHQNNPSIAHDRILGMTATFRGAIAAMRGQTKMAMEQLCLAQPYIQNDDFLTQARSKFSFGQVYELIGKTEEAVQNYLASAILAEKAGVLYLAVNARCTAALVLISQGNLRQAKIVSLESLALSEENRIPPQGLALTILGIIALERFDLELAQKYIRDGLELSKRGGLKDDIAIGLIYQARLLSASMNSSEAIKSLDQANIILNAYGIQRFLRLADTCWARLQLEIGNKNAALIWAKKYQEDLKRTNDEYLHEFEDLTLVRILLENGELENIPSILNPLEQSTLIGGRNRLHLEAMVLLALYYQLIKEPDNSLNWLEKALKSAENQGQKSLFMIEGRALLPQLSQMKSIASNFVNAILNRAKSEERSEPDAYEKLINPLSEQEIRVLKLIVDGKSNQEIADTLFISSGTAKWHVHNIFQKIGVSNRSQAMVKARKLKL